MGTKELLRHIPKVDDLLSNEAVALLTQPAAVVTDAVRRRLDELRKQIIDGQIEQLPSTELLCSEICHRVQEAAKPSLRSVINATGIVLHTNLGRACLSEKAALAAVEVARRYSTLEYDLEVGGRGSRHAHTERLLCRLTGAEAAMVVNNNAAAMLLVLSCVAKGGEVIVSRGELVEIGGSFRIPEIMGQCGCRLREVGATNKTRLQDYETAIGQDTAALLKVHTSNYRIVGFTESVQLDALVALGHKLNLPVIEDLGSGSLLNLEQFGINGEPTVMASVKAGADVVCFSGDKLLGGPQAGIILGKKALVDQFKKHPLMRAVRVDKMTLAALEATLTSYLDTKQAICEIPTLRMLAEPVETIHGRAERLQQAIAQVGMACEVTAAQTQVGGGSVPTQLLPTYAVAIIPVDISADTLECRLRHATMPIIGRITQNRYLLDVRTLRDEDIPVIVKSITEVLQ